MRDDASGSRRPGRLTWGLAALLLATALGLLLWSARERPDRVAAVDPPASAAAIPAVGAPERSGPADAPGPAREESDSLPETELPLRLVATVVRENPALSLATVEDLGRTAYQVMSEGQAFQSEPQASLVRIERGRLVLDNDGVREQLRLDRSDRAPLADAGYGPSPEDRAYRRELGRRLREVTDAGSDYLDGGVRGGLLAEGDVSAVYEDGELIGVRVDAVRDGGLYDRVGIRDGDVITSINGISLGAPTAAAEVLAGLALSDVLEVAVERGDGPPELLSVPTQALRDLSPEPE